MPTGPEPLIAVLGSINLDLTVEVDTLPRPGQTVLAHRVVRGLGGKGANQAAAAAQLLGRSRMIGAVGNDADGVWLREQLESFGVDVSTVEFDDVLASGMALIGVDRVGENSIVVVPGANAHTAASPAAIADADALMLQFEIPIHEVVHAAEQFEGLVAVNPSPSQRIPATLLERADLFVVNAEEYRDMPELADAALVAVTRGAQGAELWERGCKTEALEAYPVSRVVSTVGAGDAFFAALTCALTRAVPRRVALEIACRVAAVAVEDPCSQPRLNRLECYLDCRA
ncbi:MULTISPECIES: PfkB family carbohydrate kinase [unclassified Mycolicibacterium]|uniref:PfkB family carbohydrate kinase n=1 Tax=unclassified Mycolicibacterium TaxID=2636767 RepID=UPI002ED88F96